MSSLTVNLTQVETLPANNHFSPSVHVWDETEIEALQAALGSGRPLLVRGETGCGKSSLARAAAGGLKTQALFVQTIHPHFEATDLLYRFDHIRRLRDAQFAGASKTDQPSTDARNPKLYRAKGPIWEAWEHEGDSVVLIDEIDKGVDTSVPLTLLDVLGQRSFSVPDTGETIKQPESALIKLIIITTNEERPLPAAFLRRCVVLTRRLPEDPDELIAWFVKRGEAHFPGLDKNAVLTAAAMQIARDREQAKQLGYVPGLAEYLDLLRVLAPLGKSEQAAALDKLARYFFEKNAEQQQPRSGEANPEGGGE